jgi:hypothetical protein
MRPMEEEEARLRSGQCGGGGPTWSKEGESLRSPALPGLATLGQAAHRTHLVKSKKFGLEHYSQ